MQLVVWLYILSRFLLWLPGCRQINVYVQARNTHGGGAGCDKACMAHSHISYIGEEAELSWQTACHLIAIESPAGGGRDQVGGDAQCASRSPHPMIKGKCTYLQNV